ncbi:MAG: alfa-L-rhamnosidase, partial [Candidatus Lokiarchaeota archaeon]|nr:alfa-L-rhamnosidase [Candidatus Lokiarchaeota archaeon]
MKEDMINMIKIDELKCEYLENPLGIDVKSPRLSWILKSKIKGQKQTAYRILAASNIGLINQDHGDLWDSGKIDSNESVNIPYNGVALKKCMEVYWKVKIWDMNHKESEWSENAYWTMGLLSDSDWQANWIGLPRKRRIRLRNKSIKVHHEPCPLLRKQFHVKQKIKKAFLYISALGEYIVYLNGQRVGKQQLAPEWTDYYTRVQYQTYDVAKHLKKGDNVIGVTLADGWFMGNLGPGNPLKHTFYGRNRRLIAQLHIYYDNDAEVVITNESWKILSDGPIQMADH